MDQVIGEVQLDGAEGLDHVGDDRIEVLVAFVPGDVLVDGPAASPFGLGEKVAIEPPHGWLQDRIVRRVYSILSPSWESKGLLRRAADKHREPGDINLRLSMMIA